MLKRILLTILLTFVAIFFVIVYTMWNSGKELRKEREHPSAIEALPFESIDDIKPDTISLLERNLIGKTTLELDAYPSHTCWGKVLEDSIEGFSMANMAINRDDCRIGESKILLEKLLYRKEGRAITEVKDELLIRNHYPDTCFMALYVILAAGEKKHHYLISYHDDRKGMITKIHNLWLIDLMHAKLKPVPLPIDFKCYNPDYLE